MWHCSCLFTIPNLDYTIYTQDNVFMFSRKYFLYIYLVYFVTQGLSAFEIYEGKNLDIDLNLLLGMNYNYTATLLPGLSSFNLTEGKIALEGEIMEKAEFKISVDFTDIEMEEESLAFLRDLYGRYDFHDFFRVKAGRFEIPFGADSLKGTDSRPNIYHSQGSDKISQGRSVGVSLSGKKIFGHFEYSLSAFNNSGELSLENETGRHLFSGSLTFNNNFLDTGYNALITTDETFSQGVYMDWNFKLGEKTKLNIFCEYLEQRYFHYYWNHSVYTLLALRTGKVEPLIYFDYYNEKVGYDGEDDMWMPGLGCNIYFLDDRLRLMTDLHSEYRYSLQNSFNLKFYDTQLTLKLVLKI